jgi:hypothetical protein
MMKTHDDSAARLARIRENGHEPHAYRHGGQIRHGITVCAEPGCGRFEPYIAHDFDLREMAARNSVRKS